MAASSYIPLAAKLVLTVSTSARWWFWKKREVEEYEGGGAKVIWERSDQVIDR